MQLSCLLILGLPFSSAWSQSILELDLPGTPEAIAQEPAQEFRSAPLDPFGLDSEISSTTIPAQTLIDDAQVDIFPPQSIPDEDLPSPEPSEPGVDHLMRAPLHEAFAEIPLSAPVPNPVIARQPPEAIEEMPPDYKPEGDNIIWISGYWFWDEERDDFIWVSGVWRDAPEGQQWIEGYWHEETDANNSLMGYRWVNGFWQSTQTTTLNYLPQPPEPIEAGPSMPAPSEDYFYVPGTWMYEQSRYLWRPGYYSVYIEDLVWVPPCYVWTPCGYLFRPGYWDKPIHERGIVFAPVFFREPVYLQPNYIYRPTCTIDTGLAILPHLFVRRNHCHYYFGDWYADRYVQNDFCGWSNLGNHGFYHRQYDPLFNYYNSPMARYRNRSLVHWAGRQHRHCAGNIGLRPPAIFNLSIVNQRFSNQQQLQFHQHDHFDVLPTSQVFLGDSLGRRAKAGSLNSLNRQAERFVRIDARQQKNELEAIDRQLQKQRRDAERQLAKNFRANSPNSIVQPTQVQIVPTALTLDPERLARKERDAIRRQETQLQIQQRQAEAAARAQAKKLESDQRKMQNQLESQVINQNRQQKRAERQGNPVVNGLPQSDAQIGQPSLTGGQPLNSSANESVDKRLERQIKAEQRQQALQSSQQQRDQRKQMEAAQRQQEAAQRQAAEALKRQQRNGFGLGNQSLNNQPADGQLDNRLQRQQKTEQRQQALQLSQQQRDQRKQMDAAQRQQEAAQRQAAEAFQRQQRSGQGLGDQSLNNPSINGQIDRQMQRQLDNQNQERQRALQMNQQQRDQRKQMDAARQQQEALQRQAEASQRQAAEAMKRQQLDQARQAQEAMRQQQAQQAAQQRQMEAQQRQAEMSRRQAESQQRQAQEASQRAAEKAARDQERQQRQQERQKKKD